MAGKHKYEIDQGSTWTRRIELDDEEGTPSDLGGYSARMQIRPTLESSTVTASLTTENGGITISDGNALTLNLTATQTTAIAAGTYVYDVEIVSGAYVKRIVEGTITVRREVTR